MATYIKTLKDSTNTDIIYPRTKASAVFLEDNSTNVENELESKASLNSPEFTGTPKAPTAIKNTRNTQIATTQFVQEALDGYTGGVQIKVQSDQPFGLAVGDFWYQIV